jgi:hypothetical protein
MPGDVSIIQGLEHVDRAYEWLQDKLSRMGVVSETLIRPQVQWPVWLNPGSPGIEQVAAIMYVQIAGRNII